MKCVLLLFTIQRPAMLTPCTFFSFIGRLLKSEEERFAKF